MKNKLQILLVALALSLTLTACGQTTKTEPKEEMKQAEMKKDDMKQEMMEDNKEDMSKEMVFTLEELAKYNGKDGAKAYVAVDGVVYDVTEVKAWKEGMHSGFEAGQDLTEAIKKSPHGTAKLEGLPVVGKLAK